MTQTSFPWCRPGALLRFLLVLFCAGAALTSQGFDLKPSPEAEKPDPQSSGSGSGGGAVEVVSLLGAVAPLPVAVFDDPGFVDTSGTTDSESDNLQASLTNAGFVVSTFVLSNLVDAAASGVPLVFPEQELNALAPSLSSTDRAALSNGVAAGGVMIVHGFSPTRAAELINTVFGLALIEEGEGSTHSLSTAAAGTQFADDPGSLPANNGSTALVNTSLPPGARPIYSNGTRCLVAVIPFGSGKIIFLGWDWWNGAPLGIQDGGWLTVLQSAVLEQGPQAPSAPIIFSQPTDKTVAAGTTAFFSIGAFGTTPLDYQWRKDGVNLPGATNISLVLTNVGTNQSGLYSVVVTNALGSVTSSNASLSVLEIPAGSDFRIANLLSTGSRIVDHNALTGDDRGAIAASSSRVFYSGDSSTARFQLDDLSGGTSLGQIFDALVSDLRSGTVYSLANGLTPLTTSGGTVTTLREHDPLTGALTANTVTLSSPITLPGGGNVGIFAGYGRILLHTGTQVFAILLPTGLVVDLGSMPAPTHTFTESWAYWGVAEYFGGVHRLVYVQNSTTVARAVVPTGEVSTVANFTGLSDMAAFTVSPVLGRWYFHYEGTSPQFGGTAETIGYADAVFEVPDLPPTPPIIFSQPASQTLLTGTNLVLQVTAGPFPLSYQWQVAGTDIPQATNSTLIFSNVTVAQSGTYAVRVSNAAGTVTSSNAIVTIFPANVSTFTWEAIAPVQRVGRPFPVTVSARNAAGDIVSDFSAPVELTGFEGEQTDSPIVITEIEPGGADFIEFMNVSSVPVNLSGWQIHVYDPGLAPLPVFVIPAGAVAQPGQVFRLTESGTAPGAYPNFRNGRNISWVHSTSSEAAVLLRNAGGQMMDFAIVNGNPSLISNPAPIPPAQWSGPAIPGTTQTSLNYQRVGNMDHNGNSDWVTAAASPGLPNAGIAVPFGRAVNITPTISGPFTNGVWSGLVTVLEESGEMRLTARDPVGRSGNSSPFSVFLTNTIVVTDVSLHEGNAPVTLDLTAILTEPSTETVTVDFATVSGSAYAGEDFTATAGTVTFNPGETTKTVPIAILGDRTPELDESFRVALSNSVNAAIFRGGAVVTLLNDDTYGPLSGNPRTSWQVNGNVNAVIEHEGVVYLGGAFTEAGDLKVDKLATFARADGTLLPGVPAIDRNVTAVIEDGAGGWFVGGQFANVGGLPRLRLAHVLPDLSVDPAFVANFNNNVNALAFDGTNLYAAGQFTTVTNGFGQVSTRTRLAVLDPATGQARSFGVDPGFDNTINALHYRNGVLFVGGQFSVVNYGADFYFRTRLAALNTGTGSLTSLAIGVDNTINVLQTDGNRLYLGGSFTDVDGLPRFRVAAIDVPGEFVEAWSPQLSGQIFTILPTNGTLYVGGGFTSLTNNGVRTVRSNLVALDPITGDPGPLAPNPTGNVRALALDGVELFLGGDFQTIGTGEDRRRLASLDVTTGVLSAFDPDVSSGVFGLSVRSNFVFAAGQFTFVKGTPRSRLAALDAFDGRLLPWNPGANNTVWALAAAGEDVFAAGQFTSVGGLGRQRLAALHRTTGATRPSFQANLNSTGRTLGVWQDQLIVGGDFATITPVGGAQTRRGLASVSLASGTVRSNFVADAFPVAGSTSNLVALAVHRDVVYFSGAFTNVGGQSRQRLAAVDAATGAVQPWAPSVGTNVFALAAFDTNIYIGGEFTSITNTSGGAVTRNRLAVISTLSGNVTAWNPNANNTVAALAIGGTNLIVGGNFTTIAGVPRPRLAELDLFRNTTNASPWRPDMNASVLALGIGANGRVHAGGAFVSVNTESRRGYAVFDRFGRPEVLVAPAALTFIEDGAPLVVDPALRVYSPADQPVNGATARIGGGVAGEDVLTASPPAGINASYDGALGVMSFTGIASATDYELALRSVAYQNTSGAPTEGARTIEFRATNDSGTSALASRSIQVVSVNDAPSFTKGPDVTVAEDSGASSTPAWATNISPGPGETAQTVEFLVSNDNPALFAAPPSISPAGGLKFTPAPNAFGSAMVTVTLRDNGGTANGGSDTSAPQTFLLTVTPVNDPPTAQPRSITITEDTPVAITLMGADIDGDPLTFLIATAPTHGVLSGTPPDVTYTPAANYFGPDAFTFQVSDGQAASAPATVSLTVLSVNDAPVADASATVLTHISPNNVDAQVILDGSLSSDVDGDALTYAWREGGTDALLGSGVVAIITRPVGNNPIVLTVSDGLTNDSTTITVVVKSAAQAVGDLISFLNGVTVPRNKQALLASLEAAMASFADGNFTAGINQLEAFQHKARAQVGPDDPVLADTLISLAQQIIDAVTPTAGAPTGLLRTEMSVTAVKHLPNGRVKLHFPGWASRVYLIQASSDLVTWETIGTGRHLDRGAFEFEDAQAAQRGHRYYRVVMP